MKKITIRLIPLMLLILKGNIVLSNIHNVPSQYSSIQAGLNAANSGDTVLVQPGIYTETIIWPSKVGIRLISAGDSSNTIIDGNAVNRVLEISGTVHDTTTIIKGFTLRNGLSNSSWYGGGMYINNAGSPLIEETAIMGNKVTAVRTYGAGVSISNSNPVFRNVSICGNIAASPSCTYHYGGGVYCSNSDAVFMNVIVANNIQQTCNRTNGTGMYITNSDVKLTNVLIVNNQMQGISFQFGAGIDIGGSSDALLTNVTIAGNYHASGTSISGTGIYKTGTGKINLINTISWNPNAGNEFAGITDSIFATYSDIRGGKTGTGNINLDPNFVSATNYSLQPTSPCIDAGTFTGAPSKDILKQPRVNAPDMGAYEGVSSTGIAVNLNVSTISIFPNPVHSQLILSINNSEPGSLKIINSLGQVLFYQNLEFNHGKEISLPFENYPAGFYSVIYETKAGAIYKNLIKD